MPNLPRSQLVAYAVIAAAVLVLGARWMARQGAPAAAAGPGVVVEEPGRVERGHGGNDGGGGATLVHVAGAVTRPGVYRLPAGARVRDAVRRAGGATGRGDANGINLAAPVQDGVQIVVPRRGPAGAAPGAGAAEGAPVNLNTATAEQLETLDGVGPATSAKIIDWRKEHGGFRTVDDLGQVSGIGPKTLEALRDKVAV